MNLLSVRSANKDSDLSHKMLVTSSAINAKMKTVRSALQITKFAKYVTLDMP